jgi:hypothetical protein
MVVKHKRIQELLDEILGPTTVVRESNSEIVWKLWDEAVTELDQQSTMRAKRPHDLGRFVYPRNSLFDGSELK